MRENGTPQAGGGEINAGKKFAGEKGESGFEGPQEEAGRVPPGQLLTFLSR